MPRTKVGDASDAGEAQPRAVTERQHSRQAGASKICNAGIAYFRCSRLTTVLALCYGSRLSLSRIRCVPNFCPRHLPSTTASIFCTIFSGLCHAFSCAPVFLLLLMALGLRGQIFRPPLPLTDPDAQPSTNINHRVAPPD